MHAQRTFCTLGLGITIGVMGCWLFGGSTKPAMAANDRHDNYIICTGSAGVTPRSPLDGVWLLDYKHGKLLATIVDRTVGKTMAFAELDLMKEFGMVVGTTNFVMTTGTIAAGQAALYLAETNSGKFGVYTLGPGAAGGSGVSIMRHDLTNFRRTGS